MMQRAFLGIDIGTSKTAAVIIDAGGSTIAVASRPHRADMGGEPGHSEQDPHVLLASVWAVVGGLPTEARSAVAAVGLTGQMHGVVLLDEAGEPVGPLVTWQDGRCLEGAFLDQLNARTGAALRTGYGCATLAWYAGRGRLPGRAAAAATIHDWIAARICAMGRPVTDPTDAASWGLFDLSTGDWDSRAVTAAGFPRCLLPLVVPCGQGIGAVSAASAAMLGVTEGIPVAAAIGDNQASLLGTLRDPERELALTLGTGGQLSAVQPHGAPGRNAFRAPEPGASWEFRPYPGGRLLAVAASLCGGSAWQWLVQTIQGWQADLGLPASQADALFVRLNELAAADTGGLAVHPHFLGERHDPERRASIDGITLDNFSLGAIAHALAEGICANLRDMLPAALRAGRTRVVASGNALERNPALRKAAEAVFGLPVQLSGQAEAAAVGAARNAASMDKEEA